MSNRVNKISWLYARYNVGYDTYYGYFLKNGYDVNNRNFKIRYLIFNPDLARSDTFASSWGPLIMFFILFFVVVSIVFIRKDIISEQAIFNIQSKRPFISIQNNIIEDYEKHVIENQKPDETTLALQLKLQAEEKLIKKDEINTSVYKLNPNAIAIVACYIPYFFIVIPILFFGSPGFPTIFILGSILLFVPLYIQNTKNPTFKMKIPDEGSLIFSSRGIIFKTDKYELKNIESAVVYLESFRGFEYRDRVSTGKRNTISDGDNNKISFRFKGEVTDFTFIINEMADYWAFKNLMSFWSANGVYVVLEKVFEDDFIIQEEAHFQSFSKVN
jgi:hypothetical protein